MATLESIRFVPFAAKEKLSQRKVSAEKMSPKILLTKHSPKI
jgi:hypothetical protein